MEALGVKDVEDWPHNIFDQTYMVTFEKGKAQPILRIDLQKLMYGDRPTVDSPQPPLPPKQLEKGRAEL